MSIESLENSDLTENEREHLRKSSTLWKEMRAGRHLEDWLTLIPDLANGRRLAMRYAGVNRPEGRGYAEGFSAFLARWFPDLDKTSISCLLWLNDDPERMQLLNELRRTVPGFHTKVTSPITARKKVEAVLRSRNELEGTKPGAGRRSAGDTIRELEGRVTDLTKRLEETDGGSLFDLHYDSAVSIARIIYENVPGKAVEIAREIDKRHKVMMAEKKVARQKPAG